MWPIRMQVLYKSARTKSYSDDVALRIAQTVKKQQGKNKLIYKKKWKIVKISSNMSQYEHENMSLALKHMNQQHGQ